METSSEAAATSTQVFLDHSFANLEEALEAGTWEVDGDDVELHVCAGGEGEGPAGAVLSAKGRSNARAELCHWLNGSDGAQVQQLLIKFIVEELDAASAGTFTVGLAFDEDFEEEAILAVTVRHSRIEPTEGEIDAGGCEGEAFAMSEKMEVLLNGKKLAKDLKAMPLRIELNCRLRWEEPSRSVGVHYRILHGGASATEKVVAEGTGEANFYTPRKECTVAKALSLRAAGTTSVRLLTARCAGIEAT